MRRTAFCGIILLSSAILLAHPHFRKTLTVQLPGGVEATLAYQTTPANESLAQNAQVGEFLVPRGPRLTLSGEVKAGNVTLPAGEYTVGVIKNGAKDWTMGLYPGALGRRAKPDMAKLIKLDSLFLDSRGSADHMVLDINAGSGKFEGKAVLTLHFGSLFLAGALS